MFRGGRLCYKCSPVSSSEETHSSSKLINKTPVRVQAAEADTQVMRYTKEAAAFCTGILPEREGIK